MVKMVLKPGRVVIILLILLLCAGFLYFHHPRGLNAEDILQKALKQGKKITSYHLVLEMESNRKGEAREHFVQVWYRSPYFFRVEFFPGYPEKDDQPEQVIVSDGEKICSKGDGWFPGDAEGSGKISEKVWFRSRQKKRFHRICCRINQFGQGKSFRGSV